MTLSSVDTTDHLSVKLVSKRFCRCAVVAIKNTTTLTLAEATKCHTAIEATFPRNRPLVCCCCTDCGLVKDTDQFADPQAKKTKANRTCVACGIRNKKYSSECLPVVGREQRIPCWDCMQAMPLYDGWRLKSAEAKLLLHFGPRSKEVYCEYCLEGRLRSAFPTMQGRNQAIARIHADPACAWYWDRVGA